MTLGGEELQRARIMAGYFDRKAFAKLVGVEPRTYEGWEARKGHVPKGKEDLVRKVLADGNAPTFDPRSDIDILSALAARFAYYQERDRILTEIESRNDNDGENGVNASPDGGTDTPGPEDNDPEAAWGTGPQ